MRIIIGARGSKLSLAQTNLVKQQLESLHPGFTVKIKIVSTKGDKNMSPVPLDTVGKGWFTKELDKALLNRTIDIAVHSLKDIPEELPEGLTIAALPQREDPREALISNDKVLFEKLKKGAVIGTDSSRRKAQILHKRQDLIVTSIRGNVNTRLEKLENGSYDGIFLAVAGLKRLGLTNRITQYFSENDMIPSPGQGALAVVCRKNDTELVRVLQKINHKPTVLAVTAERAFSKTFGGGCKIPVGAFATISNNKLVLSGFVGSTDGKHRVQDQLSGKVSSPITLGKTLAVRLLKNSKPWFTVTNKTYIVITRPARENILLKRKLEQLGIHVFSYPTIEVKEKQLTKIEEKILQDHHMFDRIVFTSKNGVSYFMQAINRLHIPIDKKIPIGVVGPRTEEEAKKFGLNVDLIPMEFTTKKLGEALQNIRGKKIFLPRADIASEVLPKLLTKKGAIVTEMPIYKTHNLTAPDPEFKKLFNNNQISCLTFTSPSTVTGFLKRLHKNLAREEMYMIPVVAIGPVTARTAQELGFKKVYTADTFTADGLVAKITEVVL